MKSVEFFNDIVTIISLILNIPFVISLIVKTYSYFSQKKYIKYVLGFNKDLTQISHSTFTFSTGINKHEYITYESLESVSYMIKLLHTRNYKYKLIGNEINAKNEINIGGFISNKKVNAYFSNNFKNFKYVVNIEHKDRYDTYPVNHTMIEYSLDKTGFKIEDYGFFELNDNTDYAFLIKLVSSDFRDTNRNAIHILFGGSNIGTVKASEYLLTHCKQIYKKYNKNHYFFALEVNRTDKSINYSRGIIDLTDIMFPIHIQ